MGTRKRAESEQREPSRRGTPRAGERPARAQQLAIPGLEAAVEALMPAILPTASLGAALPGPRVAPRSTGAPPSTPAAPRARASARQCFGELRAALAEGWEIVQPIFARPLWSVTDDSATAFNFVLRRERATRLVIVPEGRSVARFIRDQRLTVDYGAR